MIAVNQQLRLARGEHGAIVVTAAWCGRCRREVLPRDDGTCSWCFARIVDEDALPARQLLALLQGGGEATYSAETDGLEETSAHRAVGVSSSPEPGSPSGPVEPAPPVSEEPSHAGDRASTPSRRRGRRRVVYDRGEIRDKLLRFHGEHGREPTFADIKACDYLPPGLAAVEWRAVALELGWTDPVAPKRAARRRPAAATSESPAASEAQEVVPAAPVAAAAPAAVNDGSLTVDDLWALYEVCVEGSAPAALKAKLRRAIEAS